MALWIESEALELRPNATEDDLQIVIRAVYRQVLGNAHILDGQSLTEAESQLRNGDITVRDFVRAVAQSDFYQARFFEPSSSYRFIELNFKHLLGRAPQDQTEIARHVLIYNEEGYTAEINSYIDSEEYIANFGDNTVPFVRGNQSQIGIKNVGFNRTFALDRGYAANDVGQSAQLISDLGTNLATRIKPPVKGGGAYTNTSKRFRIRVSNSKYGPQVRQDGSTLEVSYSQLTKTIQNLQKVGSRIVSISEAI
ncbi:MAG: phycobilisome rod-core linker polypeptide [Cyanobacteria bacterium P01_H01_bin.15]